MATLKLILSKSQQQRKVGSNQSMIMLRYKFFVQSIYFVLRNQLLCCKNKYIQSFNFRLAVFVLFNGSL